MLKNARLGSGLMGSAQPVRRRSALLAAKWKIPQGELGFSSPDLLPNGDAWTLSRPHCTVQGIASIGIQVPRVEWQ